MKLAVFLSAIALGAAASPTVAAMTLSSSDIKDGATIAAAQIYTDCGGQNVQPQLRWSGVPAGAKSLALTMIDLDVKPAQWSHWIVVDLSSDVSELARGSATLPGHAKSIASNFGDASYDGPCPPKGSGTHRYEFTIWALPVATVAIAADAKATDVRAMLAKIALDHASLAGTVQRN